MQFKSGKSSLIWCHLKCHMLKGIGKGDMQISGEDIPGRGNKKTLRWEYA